MKQDELIEMAELQRRLDDLDRFLSATVSCPGWFDTDVKPAAQDWLEGEIMQLEAEQLALLEKSKQPPGRATVSVENNLIIPSVPHWSREVQV